MKHRGIVRVQCDQQAFIEHFTYRMLTQIGQTAGSNIACHANLYGNLAFCQDFHQIGVLNGTKPMPKPFSADVQRVPNRFRASAFAGVCRTMQSTFGCEFVECTKRFCGTSALISTNSDTDHVLTSIFRRQFKDLLCRLDAEMPDGVKDPKHRQPKILFPTFTPTLDP